MILEHFDGGVKLLKFFLAHFKNHFQSVLCLLSDGFVSLVISGQDLNCDGLIRDFALAGDEADLNAFKLSFEKDNFDFDLLLHFQDFLFLVTHFLVCL